MVSKMLWAWPSASDLPEFDYVCQAKTVSMARDDRNCSLGDGGLIDYA